VQCSSKGCASVEFVQNIPPQHMPCCNTANKGYVGVFWVMRALCFGRVVGCGSVVSPTEGACCCPVTCNSSELGRQWQRCFGSVLVVPEYIPRHTAESGKPSLRENGENGVGVGWGREGRGRVAAACGSWVQGSACSQPPRCPVWLLLRHTGRTCSRSGGSRVDAGRMSQAPDTAAAAVTAAATAAAAVCNVCCFQGFGARHYQRLLISIPTFSG